MKMHDTIMITLALSFTIHKANGWGTFPNMEEHIQLLPCPLPLMLRRPMPGAYTMAPSLPSKIGIPKTALFKVLNEHKDHPRSLTSIKIIQGP